MLLDTHIFLWWLFDDPKLSQPLRQHIEDTAHTIFVSSASVWEIATKYRLGKLEEASSVAQNVPKWIAQAGFTALPITPDHAQLAGSWHHQHRDPFDRMLVAQAKIEKIPLATNDQKLSDFGIEIFQ